jgi:hypothetical protein
VREVLRLTLRSGRDGRLLARIIERDGVLFVLDFGDPVVVSDASRRVLHGGFGVPWEGSTEVALPGHPALLRHLALHYAASGLLVCVDEPGHPRLGELSLSLAGSSDVEQTEILSVSESARLRGHTPASIQRRQGPVPIQDGALVAITQPLHPKALYPQPLHAEVEDQPTEEVTRSGRLLTTE